LLSDDLFLGLFSPSAIVIFRFVRSDVWRLLFGSSGREKRRIGACFVEPWRRLGGWLLFDFHALYLLAYRVVSMVVGSVCLSYGLDLVVFFAFRWTACFCVSAHLFITVIYVCTFCL